MRQGMVFRTETTGAAAIGDGNGTGTALAFA
jgi:hypothetical protein